MDGQLVFNTLRQRLDSALQGLGLAYMPEDVAGSCIASGDLIRVLEDWCPPFSGYHLYYPSRRQPHQPFHYWWTHRASRSADRHRAG